MYIPIHNGETGKHGNIKLTTVTIGINWQNENPKMT